MRKKLGCIPHYTMFRFSVTPFKRQKFFTVRELIEIGFEDEFFSELVSATFG
jgi:hypothetical protein